MDRYCSTPVVVAGVLASIFACFAAGFSIVTYLANRLLQEDQ